MSRSSTGRSAPDGKGSLYERMLQRSTEPRVYILAPGLLSPSQAMPTREQLIDDYRGIATYTFRRDALGNITSAEPHWPTLEEAERAVRGVLAGAIGAVGASDPVQPTTGDTSHPFQTLKAG